VPVRLGAGGGELSKVTSDAGAAQRWTPRARLAGGAYLLLVSIAGIGLLGRALLGQVLGSRVEPTFTLVWLAGGVAGASTLWMFRRPVAREWFRLHQRHMIPVAIVGGPIAFTVATRTGPQAVALLSGLVLIWLCWLAWFTASHMWRDVKLLAFEPREARQDRAVRRRKSEPDDFWHAGT
jgi:hypothetical protein